VNPFLAVMNFKISVKTWIKFAKKRLRQFERERALKMGNIDKDALTSLEENESQSHKIGVEIEVEEIYEVTSEEEENIGLVSQGTIHNNGTVGSFSNQGSMSNLMISPDKMERKKKDHLKVFEKKMT